jgi:hypothetical protein
MRFTPWLLILAVVMVTGLEILGDLRLPWIWWTHKQAMDVGGLAIVVTVGWFLLRRRN